MLKKDGSEKRCGFRPPNCTPRQQIEYISDLLLEMIEMARHQKLWILAGILEVARAEARLRAKELP